MMNKRTAIKKSYEFSEIIRGLVLMLLFINIEGPDPVDYVLPIAFLISLPELYRITNKFNFKSLSVIFFLLFFGFYIASIFFGGVQISFVLNLFLNIMLFTVLLSGMSSRKSVERLIIFLTAGYCTSVIIAALQFCDFLPILVGQFEIVRDNRFMGTYGDPNILGAFSIFMSIFWLNEFIFPRMLISVSRPIVFLIILISIAVLILSLSRSAWLAMLFALTFYYVTIFREIKKGCLLIVALLISIATLALFLGTDFGDLIIERLLSISNPSDPAEMERIGFFYTIEAAKLALNHPMGVGPGMTGTDTGLVSVDGYKIGAHNSLVQIFADNGWVAGVIFIVVIFKFMQRLIRRGLYRYSFMGVGMHVLAASMIGIFICGMYQDLIQWKIMWVVPALCIGISLQERRKV